MDKLMTQTEKQLNDYNRVMAGGYKIINIFMLFSTIIKLVLLRSILAIFVDVVCLVFNWVYAKEKMRQNKDFSTTEDEDERKKIMNGIFAKAFETDYIIVMLLSGTVFWINDLMNYVVGVYVIILMLLALVGILYCLFSKTKLYTVNRKKMITGLSMGSLFYGFIMGLLFVFDDGNFDPLGIVLGLAGAFGFALLFYLAFGAISEYK